MGIGCFKKVACLGLSIAALAGLARPATATPILSVSGPADIGVAIATGEAASIAFELTQGFSGLSLSAPVQCFGCAGNVWLQRQVLGPQGNSFGNVVDFRSFDPSVTQPFFSGVNLQPGIYFLIVSIDSGFAIWESSSVGNAVLVETPGTDNGLGLFATSTTPWVPFSDFDVDFNHGQWHYTIDQSIKVVPEPGTFLLLLTGLAAASARRR